MSYLVYCSASMFFSLKLNRSFWNAARIEVNDAQSQMHDSRFSLKKATATISQSQFSTDSSSW